MKPTPGSAFVKTRCAAISLGVLSALALLGGCQNEPAVQAAQTAVSAANAALPAVQATVQAAQTALPGLQATAQAGATLVSGVLNDSQAVAGRIQALLAGANAHVTTAPPGAATDAVTAVMITATDAQGNLAQLDPDTRSTAVVAALEIVGSTYPNATISLTIDASDGSPLVRGAKQPDQAPTLQ